jgi:hypothetical protein
MCGGVRGCAGVCGGVRGLGDRLRGRGLHPEAVYSLQRIPQALRRRFFAVFGLEGEVSSSRSCPARVRCSTDRGRARSARAASRGARAACRAARRAHCGARHASGGQRDASSGAQAASAAAENASSGAADASCAAQIIDSAAREASSEAQDASCGVQDASSRPNALCGTPSDPARIAWVVGGNVWVVPWFWGDVWGGMEGGTGWYGGGRYARGGREHPLRREDAAPPPFGNGGGAF